MTQDMIEPFSLSALERLAKILGELYTGSEITGFFRKAGFPEIRHDGSTKWRFVYNALEQLQTGAYGPYNVAKVIEQLCDPEEYFGSGEAHREVMAEVNEIVGFYGLSVDERKGKIFKVERKEAALRSRESEDARAFDARDLHPDIRKHAHLLFLEGRHFHAVFECCKAFDKYMREKSRIPKHGSELMSGALSLSGPLKLNAQQSESERNEQEGVMHLCMGLMRAIRNPESHEPERDWPITKEDALDILSLISFLYRRIDEAIVYEGP